MAYPFIFHENFEGGTLGGFDSESDTGNLLDIAHYSVLAKDPNSLMPYRGAYLMRNVLGDTNDHVVVEGDIDIADAGTSYFRWYMGLSKDFRFTADDTFNVFELQQAGGTVEMSIGFRLTNTTQVIEIGIGDGTAPTSFVPWPARGKWVCVEVLAAVSTIGAGVLTLFLDGAQVATLTSLTHAAAVGRGVLGSQDTVATTLGAIYYDQFVQDDGRIYPFRERFPSAVPILKTQHVFIGPGYIDGAVLSTIATGDETLALYDTDVANVTDASPVVDLTAVAQTSGSGAIWFQRGCYAVLGGTNPKGIVYLVQSSEKPGVRGPRYQSDWGMRYWGNNRKVRGQNV
jgi:hypothetical protein